MDQYFIIRDPRCPLRIGVLPAGSNIITFMNGATFTEEERALLFLKALREVELDRFNKSQGH
jgi:hypothetical protein